MTEEIKCEPCPYFREIQDKIRNTDIGAKDLWRFVKRVRCGHKSHPSNTHPTALNPLRCGGEIGKCEIPDLWRT